MTTLTTFTNLSSALARTVALTDADPTDLQRSEHLSELLILSAGKKGTETHYRVWLVAALALQQDLEAQTLSEADKVVFTGLKTPIESFLGLQQAYDLSQGLEVPLGFGAQEFLDKLCGCGDGIGFSGANVMSAFVV